MVTACFSNHSYGCGSNSNIHGLNKCPAKKKNCNYCKKKKINYFASSCLKKKQKKSSQASTKEQNKNVLQIIVEDSESDENLICILKENRV